MSIGDPFPGYGVFFGFSAATSDGMPATLITSFPGDASVIADRSQRLPGFPRGEKRQLIDIPHKIGFIWCRIDMVKPAPLAGFHYGQVIDSIDVLMVECCRQAIISVE
mgnify:CR=1 FL=1